MKFIATIFCILIIKALCFGQDYRIGQCYFSKAYNGLNLRTSSDLKGEIIDKLEFGSEVELLQVGEDIHNIDGKTGYWLFVKHSNHKGYLFSPYIQHESIFTRTRNCSVWGNIIKGLKLNATLLDSTNFDNKISSEGSHYGTEYNWSSGIQQIHHVEYEKFMSEFIIPKNAITRNQIINIILASFKYCDDLSPENKMQILNLKKKQQINYLNNFSSIRLEEIGRNIILKLRGGP